MPTSKNVLYAQVSLLCNKIMSEKQEKIFQDAYEGEKVRKKM